MVVLDAIDDSLYQFLSCLGLSDSICFEGATVNNESFLWSHFSLYYMHTSLCTLSLLVDVKPNKSIYLADNFSKGFLVSCYQKLQTHFTGSMNMTMFYIKAAMGTSGTY